MQLHIWTPLPLFKPVKGLLRLTRCLCKVHVAGQKGDTIKETGILSPWGAENVLNTKKKRYSSTYEKESAMEVTRDWGWEGKGVSA